ncbi:MAG: glycosyltransferase family 39 protein [Parvularculaceae bacterium]|nr:glycosyltransferase family 39 protein [Parvularculaceae bacterium]
MIQLAQMMSTTGRRFAVVALVLTLLRIASLVVGHPDLGPDEAQYWFWSKSLDIGYYSKPPLVAWSIAATTAVFGDEEWAVRLSAPLYQLGAAVFLFLLTRRLSGPREAFWAGLAWLTLPGVFLSSALITTDAPLIFFWSAALYFFFRLTDETPPATPHSFAAMFGLAIGLGFLAKYAMAYFLLGAGLALIMSPLRRVRFAPQYLGIALAVALATIAPNIWWNAQNDFQTISHTAANADWNGDFGHPDRLAKFLTDQFGVAGPIMLALMMAAALFGRRTADARSREAMRALLAFALPAVVIVSAQAFVSRAHGNWAAVAYPSALVMATLFAFSRPRFILVAKLSVALHTIVGFGFLAAFASMPIAESVGASSAFRKLRGWEAQGREIARLSADFDAIMTDDREVTGELVYYARGGKPIVAWNSNLTIDSHFEAFHAFDPERDRRVLYVSTNGDALYIKNRFSRIERLGAVDADIGRGRKRTLYYYGVEGYLH